MSTIPADRLIELCDRLEAAQDILGRAAAILASMVPKPTASKPMSEIVVETRIACAPLTVCCRLRGYPQG